MIERFCRLVESDVAASPNQYLAQQLPNHMPMHVRQPSVDPIMPDRELQVIDAEQVEEGGVEVVDVGGVIAVGGFVAEVVGGAEGEAGLDAAAAEPVGEAVGVVVAAFAALRARHAAELGGP